MVFNIKRNLFAGFWPVVWLGIITTMLNLIEGVLRIWDPLIEKLPVLGFIVEAGGFPSAVVRTLSVIGLWGLVMYAMGFLLRNIGLRVGQDVERARRFTKAAKRIKLGWLWRIVIGWAILTDALTGLQRVRMEEYAGKRGFGFITKVQRVHHSKRQKPRFEFIVYAGDFPTLILGRWNWYEVSRCQKLLNPLGEMLITFGSVGLAAPTDLRIDDFTQDDLLRISRELKAKEAMLVAAGLLDPDQRIEDIEEG